MLNVETLVQERYPRLWRDRPLLARPLVTALRLLFHEKELQQFEAASPHLRGFDFVEQVLAYFDFTYRVRDSEWERIPAQGKVVIVANHPLGTLDGLVLLKLVREVRRDVKVMANDVLSTINPLASLLLPVDNMGGSTPRKNLRAIHQFLADDGALIIFPAGEVSRFGAKGVRDGEWRTGFLRIAVAAKAPILPIHVDGRNSAFFYALSFLARPVSTLWLVREMFKQAKRCIDVRIGQPIGYRAYARADRSIATNAAQLRRHLYRIGSDRSPILATEKAIAHPEDRLQLRMEIRACTRLGETRDNKQIYLYQHQPDSAIMREIGRLRELTFRAVGEGTGERRDIDNYDRHYLHLLLWDTENLEIVGAYRLCDAAAAIRAQGPDGLYSHSLFRYTAAMKPYLERGLELGRSFVQPSYWGKRSLDYLWYGIGAFLRQHSHYRYLFGPVTLSNSYPPRAMAALVHFYQRHYGALQVLAEPRLPYEIDPAERCELSRRYPGQDRNQEFRVLKSELVEMGLSVPTLYKQYTEICDLGGVQFAAFNVDPTFADCVDGLVIVDLARLKPMTRNRYLECGQARQGGAAPLVNRA